MMDSALEQILRECYLDTKKFARTFFPHLLNRPFCALHDRIFEKLDDPSIKKLVIKAPRGFGKTTLLSIIFLAKQLVYNDARFIVPISNTAKQALLIGENLKHEIQSNIMLRTLFGPMKGEAEWSKEEWITQRIDGSIGAMVMPRGSGQQVRGLLFRGNRPNLIFIDDVEDAEHVQSEEQRAKLEHWIFNDVLRAVNMAEEDWRVIVVGTLLHEASLLSKMLTLPDWEKVEISLCDDQYHSNWPAYMDDDDIQALVESYRLRGKLDEFYQEYMGMMASSEDASFKSTYFKYFEQVDVESKTLETIILVDPAKSVKPDADYSAIIGVSVDRVLNRIYIRDLVMKRIHMDEIFEEAFQMAHHLRARTIGLEVTSLNDFITFPFQNAMKARGEHFELLELKARGKKEDRIKAMIPFYRLGQVYHNRAVCAPLEAQLLSFPRAAHDDAMDAEAYFIQAFALGERFFLASISDPKDPESEFKALDKYFDELPPMDTLEYMSV